MIRRRGRSVPGHGVLIGLMLAFCLPGADATAPPLPTGATATTEAGAPGDRDDDAYAMMDLVPPGLDVIAVLNAPGRDAAVEGGEAGEPAGGRSVESTVFAWLRGMGMMGETARSWSALAARLGMNEADATRALLGGPVVIGWDGVTDGGVLGAIGAADRGWLLVGTVSDETAGRLRERLDAVPRRISSGYAVYTVDTGQTGMALVGDGSRWRMVLSPVQNAGLVDETLRRFRARVEGGEVDERSNAADARALGVSVDHDWTALVSVRLDQMPDAPVVFSMRSGADWFTARYAIRGRYRHGAPVDVLDAIGEGSLLAVAMAGEPWNGSDAIILSLQAEENATDAPIRFPDGFTMSLREPGVPGSGQLTAVINGRAITDDAFGEGIDRALSGMIGGEQPPAHRGRFPDAVRTHAVPDGRGPEAAGWSGGKTRVAWCFRGGEDDRSGVVSIAIGDRDADVAGHARRGREAWTRSLASGAWVAGADVVMRGIARPGALIDAMGMASDPFLGLVGQIEHASWDLRQSGDVLRGELNVRLKPTRARLGGR